MRKKRIISIKGIIAVIIIIMIVLIGGFGGLKLYQSFNKPIQSEEKNDIETNAEELKNTKIEEEVFKEQDTNTETKENDIMKENKEPNKTENKNTNKNSTTNKSSSSQNKNENNSSTTNTGSSNSNSNEQTKPKKMTKEEIKKYVQEKVPDFRYDFDSIKECQEEGDKWMEYGWFYNCPTVKVPDADVTPTMLVISTGKFFCDGAYTKNEKYDYRKPKISSLAYLRSIGYPCANIEDN